MDMFVNTDGKADLNLPDTISAGFYQKLGESFAVMGDVAWTNWSRFDELRIDYDSAQPDSVTDESWDDTWRFAVGLNYYLNPEWTLRCGAAFDETPVPDAEHRTPRIPDSDRTWLALGAGYQPSESLHLDVGYVHIFFKDCDSALVSSTGDVLLGEYKGHVDIASLQLRWTF